MEIVVYLQIAVYTVLLISIENISDCFWPVFTSSTSWQTVASVVVSKMRGDGIPNPPHHNSGTASLDIDAFFPLPETVGWRTAAEQVALSVARVTEPMVMFSGGCGQRMAAAFPLLAGDETGLLG